MKRDPLQRIFDPVDIAKSVADGVTVRIGTHLVIWRAGKLVTQKCERCRCEQVTALMMIHADQFADFLMQHQHAGLPS